MLSYDLWEFYDNSMLVTARAASCPAITGSTVREILNRTQAEKISSSPTLPENLSRINRALIENILAGFDFCSNGT